jgi:site-specific recombinase XerD
MTAAVEIPKEDFMARTRKAAQQTGGRPRLKRGRGATLTLVPPRADVAIPEPPLRPDGKELCANAQQSWADYWTSPLPGALTTFGTDAGMVRRWVTLLDWREELEAAIQEVPAVDGSGSNKVLSPFNRLRVECVREIERIEAQLGLTPAARQKLGIVVAGGGRRFQRRQPTLEAAAMNDLLREGAVDRWEHARSAFLAEKERRSGSQRTVQSYAGMLRSFFGQLGKTPDAVTPADVLAYAHGVGASGRAPSPHTTAARIACVSSFYKFLIRLEVHDRNPCDALERPRPPPSTPRGLSADEVQRVLAVIPDTAVGRRDRAIILWMLLTGRRRSEVMHLTAGDIELGNPAFYTYRAKGGKRGRRELPAPVLAALVAALAAFGCQLATMAPTDSLWPRAAHAGGVSGGTVYAHFQRYLRDAGLPPGGLHLLRHTAAKLRREAGESIETVSQFLDHSSLAVTTVYLRRLEGEQDPGWPAVAQLIAADHISSTMA